MSMTILRNIQQFFTFPEDNPFPPIIVFAKVGPTKAELLRSIADKEDLKILTLGRLGGKSSFEAVNNRIVTKLGELSPIGQEQQEAIVEYTNHVFSPNYAYLNGEGLLALKMTPSGVIEGVFLEKGAIHSVNVVRKLNEGVYLETLHFEGTHANTLSPKECRVIFAALFPESTKPFRLTRRAAPVVPHEQPDPDELSLYVYVLTGVTKLDNAPQSWPVAAFNTHDEAVRAMMYYNSVAGVDRAKEMQGEELKIAAFDPRFAGRENAWELEHLGYTVYKIPRLSLELIEPTEEEEEDEDTAARDENG